MSDNDFEIKVEHVGMNHYLASCYVCGWTFEELDARKGNRHARRHTARTGHIVYVEKAVVRRYRKETS